MRLGSDTVCHFYTPTYPGPERAGKTGVKKRFPSSKLKPGQDDPIIKWDYFRRKSSERTNPRIMLRKRRSPGGIEARIDLRCVLSSTVGTRLRA